MNDARRKLVRVSMAKKQWSDEMADNEVTMAFDVFRLPIKDHLRLRWKYNHCRLILLAITQVASWYCGNIRWIFTIFAEYSGQYCQNIIFLQNCPYIHLRYWGNVRNYISALYVRRLYCGNIHILPQHRPNTALKF